MICCRPTIADPSYAVACLTIWSSMLRLAAGRLSMSIVVEINRIR